MAPTYSDMVYHMGGVPSNAAFPFVVGNVYFVSSVTGSSANDGKTKDTPFNTFARAMAFTTTNDCVVLMPGHAETISTTADFAVDQAGLIVWELRRSGFQTPICFDITNSICAICHLYTRFTKYNGAIIIVQGAHPIVAGYGNFIRFISSSPKDI